MTYHRVLHRQYGGYGFSLMEMTLVLLVLSIITASGLTLYSNHDEKTKTAETNARLDKIEKALDDFRFVNNRLPCPADASLPQSDVNFGQEGMLPGECNTQTPQANFSNGNTVAGAIPVRTLNLANDDMYDAWGRKFEYMVDKRITGSSGTIEYAAREKCIGSIQIDDASNTARTDKAVYALISFGMNGHGAFLSSGNRLNAKSINAQELLNAGVTSGFTNNFSNRLVMRRRMENATNSKNSFDDILRYKQRWSMVNAADVAVGMDGKPQQYFTKVDSFYYAKCGLTSSHNIYCWGNNEYGQIGDGSNYERHTPVSIILPIDVGSWQDVQTGYQFACALADTGRMYCWGKNDYGRLGDGTNNDRNEPTEVDAPIGMRFTKFDIGNYHVCAIADTGKPYCWGRNTNGQLGNNSTVDSYSPVAVTLPSGVTAFSSLSLSRRSATSGSNWEANTCGFGDDAELYCWGRNDYGQLGDNSTTDRLKPTLVPAPVGVKFKEVQNSGWDNYTLGDNGRIYAMGRGTYGKIGNGSSSNQKTPTLVTLPAGVTSFTGLYLNDDIIWGHVCAKGNNDQLYCWGDNSVTNPGALGDGTFNTGTTPQMVVNGTGFIKVYADYGRTCGIKTDGHLFCWGRGFRGGTGTGAEDDTNTPVDITPGDVPGFKDITMGYQINPCGITIQDKLYCWGSNVYGEVGDGQAGMWRLSPVAVDTGILSNCN